LVFFDLLSVVVLRGCVFGCFFFLCLGVQVGAPGSRFSLLVFGGYRKALVKFGL